MEIKMLLWEVAEVKDVLPNNFKDGNFQKKYCERMVDVKWQKIDTKSETNKFATRFAIRATSIIRSLERELFSNCQ